MAVRRWTRSGFSLIEMMIAFVLIGLLAMIAVPSSADAIAHSQVNKAAAIVRNDLELALALAARQHHALRIDATSSSYAITDRSGDTLLVRMFGSGSELGPVGVTFSALNVDVFPTGLASGPLTVTVARNTYQRAVTMSRSGQLRVAP